MDNSFTIFAHTLADRIAKDERQRGGKPWRKLEVRDIMVYLGENLAKIEEAYFRRGEGDPEELKRYAINVGYLAYALWDKVSAEEEDVK